MDSMSAKTTCPHANRDSDARQTLHLPTTGSAACGDVGVKTHTLASGAGHAGPARALHRNADTEQTYIVKARSGPTESDEGLTIKKP